MNSKTAKQLARAAAAISLIEVSNTQALRPQRQRLSPRDRLLAVQRSSSRVYESLKRRWYGTPRPQRSRLRRYLNALTLQTKHALRKGAQQ